MRGGTRTQRRQRHGCGSDQCTGQCEGMTMSIAAGQLFGIGLGPGDPELLTVKAVRLLQAAPIVAYFAKSGRPGNARTIADRWISASCEEVQLPYPITTEISFKDPAYVARIAGFYQDSAAT